MNSIWDDISREQDIIPVIEVSYPLTKISEDNYYKFSSKTINLDRTFLQQTDDSVILLILCNKIFDTSLITPVDKVYINLYYRKVLRKYIEEKYINLSLTNNLIITDLKYDFDQYILKYLQILRIVCKYLGIPNTYTASSFDKNKLNNKTFWNNISEHMIPVWGENVHNIILPNVELTYIFLAKLFNFWSHTKLKLNDNDSKIHVIPSVIISSLSFKLKKDL